MSFIITVYTNEGIIMASDSRTTYTNTNRLPDGTVERGIGIQITDSTYKTFICNNRVGISTCGAATIKGAPIAGHIERFIANNLDDDSSVEDVAQSAVEYFSSIAPSIGTNFIVAGYNKDDSLPHISRVYISTKNVFPIQNTNIPGAIWDGETDVLQRLIKEAALKKEDGAYSDLASYPIAFNFFTLQDAIDFAEYAVDVTIKTMFFQTRVKTVGGPIDILAIKPSGAFWVQRKELHA